MNDLLTRVKFGVVGGISVFIFAAAMFVGLSDTGPGPVKAFVGTILLIGYKSTSHADRRMSSQAGSSFSVSGLSLGVSSLTARK